MANRIHTFFSPELHLASVISVRGSITFPLTISDVAEA
jgi:hypothetical protein